MGRSLRSGVPLVVLLLATLPASADVKSKLLAGKILTTSIPSDRGWPGRAMGIVNASAESVYRLLADVPSYKHFVPLVRSSRRIGDNRYELTAKFPWPVSKTTVRLKVRKGRKKKVYVLTWKMYEGTLERYEGAAWIQPYGKGRSVLTYQMLAKPKVPTPDGFMISGMRTLVKGMVRAVRKRISETASR